MGCNYGTKYFSRCKLFLVPCDDLIIGLSETIDRLARANAVRWYGHVLRRDECDVLRRALDFQVEGKRRRGRPKAMWKSQVEEESRRIGLTK